MNKNEIHPWSYILQQGGKRIFHVTDMGLNPKPNDSGIAVATFEYSRDDTNQRYSKNGIKKPWDDVDNETTTISGKTFDHRRLPVVNLNEESNVVRPTAFLQKIITGEILGNHQIPTSALRYFITALGFEEAMIENIGIEGSLCIGQASENSDLDLLIYGYQNYQKIIQRLGELFVEDSNIIALDSFDYGTKELISRRKDHSPFTEEELLFVTRRRPYFYIKQITSDGAIVYTKVSLFGVVGKTDGQYREDLDLYLKPIEVKRLKVVTINGKVSDATLGLTIPSVWKVDSVYQGVNIDYIVDYAGVFPEHLQTGENFEARGMLEEYKDARGVQGYRLVIAYWDQHIKNNMYVKPILN